MNIEELNGKRIMHIDTSCRLAQNKHTGIAYKIIESGENKHKGVGLKLKLKKELDKYLNADQDYARIYAICIYYLIKDDLDKFDIAIICNDEDYKYVEEYLNLLFLDNEKYKSKDVISIRALRKITGDQNLRSYADNIARSYRKRSLKSNHRQRKGIPLNVIRINFSMFKEKWNEIEEKIKK